MSIKKAGMSALLPPKQMELTEKNFTLFAARNYINPRVLDPEEFEEDLIRFKYLKRLFSRYKEKQELQERLILNHLTVIHNVFRLGAATEMCFFKIDPTLWPALKTFLLYLNLLPLEGYESIPTDLYVARQLQLL
jgi:hypothetical protein